MKYFIYHIPGKKIGVTRNLDKRVTQQQGYAEEEYEVLFVSDDIDQVSKLEIELQKSYGYPIDRIEYKNLFKSNTMKINVTEQTTTFPVHILQLKEYLGSVMGLSWVIPQGDRFTLSGRNAEWILDNAMKSMYTEDRCYIYNEAFKKYEQGMFAKVEPQEEEVAKFELIRKWAEERGIYKSGDKKTQYVKLMEESGELAQAILKNDDVEFVDAIGDMVVVLTNLAHLGGYKIEECIDAAYTQIANRKGKMENGTFVKEEAFSNYLKSKTETL
jgi:NTP pyrophosphatase (non-canonical NTP hydrolase)